MLNRQHVDKALYPLLSLTPIQKMLFNDDQHRIIATSSGRRSRKTLIFKRKMLLTAMRNPGVRLFHGAPTQQQAKKIFWIDLKRTARYFTSAISETDHWVRLTNGSEIHVAGLDKPQRVEGQPWDGFHITEMPDLKPLAWRENLLPLISDTNGFAWLDGVPNGRDATYYPLCLDCAGGVIPQIDPALKGGFAESLTGDMAYYLWHSSSVLTPEQLQMFLDIMDERTFRQEFEGSFEAAGGLAYWAFGKHNLDPSLQRDKNRQVTVGMDFNVNPMTAALLHIDQTGRKIQQFDEIYLNHSNTYEMAEEVKRRLGLMPHGDQSPGSVVIIPDSTGSAMKSSGLASDISVLKQAGFTVYHRANPDQRDRLMAFNSLCRSANGKIGYTVNPQTCKKTVNDFGLVTMYDDGRINKGLEKDGVGHISDAVTYPANYYFPIRSRQVGLA